MNSGLTGPNQESLQEGPCDPTMDHCGATAVFGTQEYNRVPHSTSKGQLKTQIEISWGERTAKEVLSPLQLQWESAFCGHQSWNLLIMIIKHQSRSFFGRKSQPKYSIL